MKIVVINGQSKQHKGSTYNITHMLLDKLGKNEITEFFLPDDFDEFCTGCFKCITQGPKFCPHYKKVAPITKAIEESDLIILSSPTYAFHCSGQMKALLDHEAYHWISHRPLPCMFSKQGVAITTCTGAGRATANFDMTNSLFFWGVGKQYRLSAAVAGIEWKKTPEKVLKKISKDIKSLVKKIKKNHGHVKPDTTQKAFFRMMRRCNGVFECDKQYWKETWSGRNRPWKKK